MSRRYIPSFTLSFVCIFLLASCGLAQDAYKQCYLPDGSQATNPQWAPCSNDKSSPLSNVCCALNRNITSGGTAGDEFTVADVCLDNGLCLNRWKDTGGAQHEVFFRAYCTNTDFNSGKCLNICGATGTGWKKITPCDGTQNSSLWCCGDNTDCCNQGLQDKQGLKPVSVAANFETTSATAAAVSSATSQSVVSSGGSSASKTLAATSASTTPSTTGGAAASSSQTTSETGLSTGAKAGIGVGAAGGALALIGMGALLIRRRRAAASKPAELPDDNEIVKYGYVQPDGTYLEANGHRDPGELSDASIKRAPMELSATEVTAELPGSEGHAWNPKGRN